MKLKLMVTASILAFIANSAAAQDIYGRVDTGYSWTSNGVDGSAIAGVGLGTHLGYGLRADATIGYRGWYKAHDSVTVPPNTLAGSADVSSTVALANLYYDIGTYDRFTPYIGGGIGAAYNHTDTADLDFNGAHVGTIGSANKTNFAWQAGFGTGIALAQNISLDVGYRYVDMGKAETSDSAVVLGTPVTGAKTSVSLHASELQAGIRVGF